MDTENVKPKDLWDKAEIIGKVLAGISIPIIGLVVTGVLQTQSKRSSEWQFQSNLRQARETADTELRAKMFDFLLTRYFSAPNSASHSVQDFQTHRMVLRLLQENFGEHFNSKALFTHLYLQAQDAEREAKGDTKSQWHALKDELIEDGKNATTEQLISLAPAALSVQEDFYVPLEKINGAQADPSPRIQLYLGSTNKDGTSKINSTPSGLLPVKHDDASQAARYSIALTVREIREDAATVTVYIHDDEDKGNDTAKTAAQPPKPPLVGRYVFDASFFSTPYSNNTLLSGGTRFAVVYKGCLDRNETDRTCRFPLNRQHDIEAQFTVVTFPSDFSPLTERPELKKLVGQLPDTAQSPKSWPTAGSQAYASQ